MKQDLRNQLKNKRAELNADLQQKKSANIVAIVRKSEAFKQAINVGFYHSVRGEADPAELCNSSALSENPKKFYLPVLSPNEKQGLLFGEVTADTQFKINKFSIPEPVFDLNQLITGESLDLVLVPLLGFDTSGNRLGMGGGFYDRSFSFKKSGKTKPLLMGFAYDFQQVSALSAEEWDVPLDFIATESQLFEVS